MSRIRVFLQDVICADTEDVTGDDEFYLVGTVVVGSFVVPILTQPIQINNQQTLPLGIGAGTVFDFEVPDNQIVKIALTAFDEDAAKDWSTKYQDAINSINQSITQTIGFNPLTPALGLANVAVGALGWFVQFDQDDALGQWWTEFPVWAWNPGTYWYGAPFKGGSTFFSDWDYVVRLAITKG